jgi:hypothetical protein
LAATSAALLTSVIAREAIAQTSEGRIETIRLLYTAEPGCPDALAFTHQLFARTTRARVSETSTGRAFTVRVTHAGEGFQGALEIRETSGQSLGRDIPGDSCDEVVAAAALVAALAIDPQASTQPIHELEAQQTPPTPAPRQDEPPKIAPPPEPTSPWRGAAGAAFGARTATAPVTAPVGLAFGELAYDRGTWLTPAMRLAIGASLSRSASTAGGTASFSWIGGRAEICPVRVQLATTLDARPCTAFELGSISASADGVVDPRSRSHLWTAAAGAARIEWELFPRTAFIDAAGEISAPFVRERFYFGPNATLFQVPAVGFGAWLGLRFVLFS